MMGGMPQGQMMGKGGPMMGGPQMGGKGPMMGMMGGPQMGGNTLQWGPMRSNDTIRPAGPYLGKTGFGGWGSARPFLPIIKNGKGHKVRTYILIQSSLVD